MFAQLGAAPDLARVEALAHREAAWKAHGLTASESCRCCGWWPPAPPTTPSPANCSWPRRRSTGTSATSSPLGVSSRAAATAYAYQHRLL